jgi:hypothetical protein
LARPSIDPAHDALHSIERGAVQGLLEIGGSPVGREDDLKVPRLPARQARRRYISRWNSR